MEGALQRKGTNFLQLWKRLYFRLENSRLIVAEKEEQIKTFLNNQNSAVPPKGVEVFPLRCCTQLNKTPNAKDGREFSIKFTDGKELVLKANSFQEKQLWMNLLQVFDGAGSKQAAGAASSSSASNSSGGGQGPLVIDIPDIVSSAISACLDFLLRFVITHGPSQSSISRNSRNSKSQPPLLNINSDLFTIPVDESRVKGLYYTLVTADKAQVPLDSNPSVVSSTLNRLLDSLPESLLTDRACDNFAASTPTPAADSAPHILQRLSAALPPKNKTILQRLIGFVAQFELTDEDRGGASAAVKTNSERMLEVLAKTFQRKDQTAVASSSSLELGAALTVLTRERDFVFNNGPLAAQRDPSLSASLRRASQSRTPAQSSSVQPKRVVASTPKAGQPQQQQPKDEKKDASGNRTPLASPARGSAAPLNAAANPNLTGDLSIRSMTPVSQARASSQTQQTTVATPANKQQHPPATPANANAARPPSAPSQAQPQAQSQSRPGSAAGPGIAAAPATPANAKGQPPAAATPKATGTAASSTSSPGDPVTRVESMNASITRSPAVPPIAPKLGSQPAPTTQPPQAQAQRQDDPLIDDASLMQISDGRRTPPISDSEHDHDRDKNGKNVSKGIPATATTAKASIAAIAAAAVAKKPPSVTAGIFSSPVDLEQSDEENEADSHAGAKRHDRYKRSISDIELDSDDDDKKPKAVTAAPQRARRAAPVSASPSVSSAKKSSAEIAAAIRAQREKKEREKMMAQSPPPKQPEATPAKIEAVQNAVAATPVKQGKAATKTEKPTPQSQPQPQSAGVLEARRRVGDLDSGGLDLSDTGNALTGSMMEMSVEDDTIASMMQNTADLELSLQGDYDQQFEGDQASPKGREKEKEKAIEKAKSKRPEKEKVKEKDEVKATKAGKEKSSEKKKEDAKLQEIAKASEREEIASSRIRALTPTPQSPSPVPSPHGAKGKSQLPLPERQQYDWKKEAEKEKDEEKQKKSSVFSALLGSAHDFGLDEDDDNWSDDEDAGKKQKDKPKEIAKSSKEEEKPKPATEPVKAEKPNETTVKSGNAALKAPASVAAPTASASETVSAPLAAQTRREAESELPSRAAVAAKPLVPPARVSQPSVAAKTPKKPAKAPPAKKPPRGKPKPQSDDDLSLAMEDGSLQLSISLATPSEAEDEQEELPKSVLAPTAPAVAVKASKPQKSEDDQLLLSNPDFSLADDFSVDQKSKPKAAAALQAESQLTVEQQRQNAALVMEEKKRKEREAELATELQRYEARSKALEGELQRLRMEQDDAARALAHSQSTADAERKVFQERVTLMQKQMKLELIAEFQKEAAKRKLEQVQKQQHEEMKEGPNSLFASHSNASQLASSVAAAGVGEVDAAATLLSSDLFSARNEYLEHRVVSVERQCSELQSEREFLHAKLWALFVNLQEERMFHAQRRSETEFLQHQQSISEQLLRKVTAENDFVKGKMQENYEIYMKNYAKFLERNFALERDKAELKEREETMRRDWESVTLENENLKLKAQIVEKFYRDDRRGGSAHEQEETVDQAAAEGDVKENALRPSVSAFAQRRRDHDELTRVRDECDRLRVQLRDAEERLRKSELRESLLRARESKVRFLESHLDAVDRIIQTKKNAAASEEKEQKAAESVAKDPASDWQRAANLFPQIAPNERVRPMSSRGVVSAVSSESSESLKKLGQMLEGLQRSSSPPPSVFPMQSSTRKRVSAASGPSMPFPFLTSPSTAAITGRSHVVDPPGFSGELRSLNDMQKGLESLRTQ